jgi:hypothetical protein
MKKVTVSSEALVAVLHALVGPDYFIRELQATRDKPPFLTGNPIDILIKEYNEAVVAYNQEIEANGSPTVIAPREHSIQEHKG